MSEERESRRIWWIAGGVVAALVVLKFLPEVENPLAPEPVTAHVAVLASGSAVARDGSHELNAGEPFRLFAVLEARDWRGETVWFSEAPALELGGQAVDPERLRPWPDDPLVKVRWFTVEGAPAYLAAATPEDLARFRLEENFHPDWGSGWAVEGTIDPRLVLRDPDSPLRPLPFGTQRFAVRIEFYASPGALIPERRASAPSAEAVLADSALGIRVEASLPPPLRRVSAAFGRPEVDPVGTIDSASAQRIAQLVDASLAYLRADLLAAHLADAGTNGSALRWRAIDLAAERPRWGDGAAAGDLLQAGPRIVVLFRDDGEIGALDPADLVFDLWEGLRIRRIDEIFLGEGSLELELATLPRPAG